MLTVHEKVTLLDKLIVDFESVARKMDTINLPFATSKKVESIKQSKYHFQRITKGLSSPEIRPPSKKKFNALSEGIQDYRKKCWQNIFLAALNNLPTLNYSTAFLKV